ncbi:MAG: hypothetical protein ACUVQ8_06850 [Nitrososphaeria archaeon]
MWKPREATVICLLLLSILAFIQVPTVLGYSNPPLWSSNLITYAPQKLRISQTSDQDLVFTSNRSFVIGLNVAGGQISLSYLPARNSDVIDGVIAHPSGKYIVSIVNGSYVNVFNQTRNRSSTFKANSSVKNILLPQTYSGGPYTLFYSTADYSLSRVDISVPGSPSLAWKIHFSSDVNALDADDSLYRIVAGLNNGTLLVLDPLNGGVLVKRDFGVPITSMKISAFGFFLALTTSDGMFYFVRTDNLYVLQSFSFEAAKGVSTAISYDGEKVAVGLSNGTIFYFRYLTGEQKKAAVYSSAISLVADKNLDYVAWASNRQVGLTKFGENSLWSSTVSDTATDISVSIANENPLYVISCSKTRILVFDRRPVAQITMSASPQTVGIGKDVTLSGQLTPTLANQTIRFYIRSNSSDVWKMLGDNKTDSSGRFRFRWKVNVTGSPSVKVTWSGNEDFRESEATLSLDVRRAVTVTVRATTIAGNPIPNTRITVNGTKYYTNQSGYLTASTYVGTLTLNADNSFEFATDSRYQFKMWDPLEISRNQISLKIESDMQLTAKYTIAYRVNFTLPKYFLVDTSPSGNDGWFENGTAVKIIPLPLSEEYNTSSSRILFVGWQGTGRGSYSGPSLTPTVKVLEPIKESILWKRQFRLGVITSPSPINTSVISVNPSSKDYWFDEGSVVALEAPETVPYLGGIRYVFSLWKIDTATYGNKVLNLMMDMAKTVNASFYIQYFLDISADVGRTTGTGWYNQSQKATFSVLETTIPSGSGIRKKFVGWVGNFTSAAAIGEVLVDGPMAVHANYVTQFYLNATSQHSRVILEGKKEDPSGWYNEGARVTFSIESLREEKDFFSYYSFDGWRGDVESMETTVSVNIVRPTTVKAEWTEEMIVENVLLIVIPAIVVASLVSWFYYRKIRGKTQPTPTENKKTEKVSA